MNILEIKQSLEQLPEKIKQAEIAQEHARLQVDEAAESVELAELNAMLTATVDGSNEKTREQQRRNAIAKDKDVAATKAKLAEAKFALSSATADENALRRQYGAMLAIAEVTAAQLNLQAAQTKEKERENHGKH